MEQTYVLTLDMDGEKKPFCEVNYEELKNLVKAFPSIKEKSPVKFTKKDLVRKTEKAEVKPRKRALKPPCALRAPRMPQDVDYFTKGSKRGTYASGIFFEVLATGKYPKQFRKSRSQYIRDGLMIKLPSGEYKLTQKGMDTLELWTKYRSSKGLKQAVKFLQANHDWYSRAQLAAIWGLSKSRTGEIATHLYNDGYVELKYVRDEFGKAVEVIRWKEGMDYNSRTDISHNNSYATKGVAVCP